MYKDLVISIHGCCAVDENLLVECSHLFSDHYGVWNKYGPHPGKHMKLSPMTLEDQFLTDDERSSLMTARFGKILVGMAFVHQFPFRDGIAAWISLLVVHSTWRSRGIARCICSHAFNEQCVAVGTVSCHPHAINALERATGWICIPKQISRFARELINKSGIPRFQNKEILIDGNKSIIKTGVYLDHTDIDEMVSRDPMWMLGALEDGDEYFAFAFKD
jgi:hypothetical protein